MKLKTEWWLSFLGNILFASGFFMVIPWGIKNSIACLFIMMGILLISNFYTWNSYKENFKNENWNNSLAEGLSKFYKSV